MKILMTGFTALQVKSERSPIQKIDGPRAIVKALRECGHEVDWRLVKLGEDLSSYDVIWVNLAPINSINGRKGAMGAVWALGAGKPVVGFFDDWQFEAVFRGMTAMLRNRPKTLYKHLVGGDRKGVDATHWSEASARAAMDEATRLGGSPEMSPYFYMETESTIKPHEDRLFETMKRFKDEPWFTPVIPAYTWGNRRLVRVRMDKQVGKPLGPMYSIDLSPIIVDDILLKVNPIPLQEKKQEWLLAALMPHGDWLDKQRLDWPVHIVGSQKLTKERNGERVKTEVDVLERYNQRVGALSPAYMHAGSGWWRSRFLYAARVGSVLVTDRGEASALGDAYSVLPHQIESMGPREIEQVVTAQRDALRPTITSYDQFVATCNGIVAQAWKDQHA